MAYPIFTSLPRDSAMSLVNRFPARVSSLPIVFPRSILQPCYLENLRIIFLFLENNIPRASQFSSKFSTTFEFSNFVPLTDGFSFFWNDRERIRHHRCASSSFLSFSLVQWIFLAVREVSIRIGKKGKEGSINRADWGEKGSFPRGEGVFDSHVSFPSTSFFIHRSVVVFEPALLRSSNVRVNANCFKRLISISNLWEM